MKTFLIEFEAVCVPDRPIAIIEAKTESQAWDKAYEQSQKPGYSEGNFDMYMLLRNSRGELYLAEPDGEPIKSN